MLPIVLKIYKLEIKMDNTNNLESCFYVKLSQPYVSLI